MFNNLKMSQLLVLVLLLGGNKDNFSIEMKK